MVLRDHTAFGSADAFFKESMRRDAMTGTRTVFALEMHVNNDIGRSKAALASSHPGNELNILLKIHAR
jgi:hypothetical protein